MFFPEEVEGYFRRKSAAYCEDDVFCGHAPKAFAVYGDVSFHYLDGRARSFLYLFSYCPAYAYQCADTFMRNLQVLHHLIIGLLGLKLLFSRVLG
jgi:hypothetical protein